MAKANIPRKKVARLLPWQACQAYPVTLASPLPVPQTAIIAKQPPCNSTRQGIKLQPLEACQVGNPATLASPFPVALASLPSLQPRNACKSTACLPNCNPCKAASLQLHCQAGLPNCSPCKVARSVKRVGHWTVSLLACWPVILPHLGSRCCLPLCIIVRFQAFPRWIEG